MCKPHCHEAARTTPLQFSARGSLLVQTKSVPGSDSSDDDLFHVASALVYLEIVTWYMMQRWVYLR